MTAKEYNKCVELFSDGIFRFIYKQVKKDADARDVVQNTFEKLWRNCEKVTFAKAKSFLFTTARNDMIDGIRKVKRMSWVEEVPERSVNDSGKQYELKEALSMGLEKLSEVQRSAIMLRDYEGYSYKEISEILNLSEAQVKVYIFRGRKKLQAFLISMDKAM